MTSALTPSSGICNQPAADSTRPFPSSPVFMFSRLVPFPVFPPPLPLTPYLRGCPFDADQPRPRSFTPLGSAWTAQRSIPTAEKSSVERPEDGLITPPTVSPPPDPGAAGGTRTRTILRSGDFKSPASAISPQRPTELISAHPSARRIGNETTHSPAPVKPLPALVAHRPSARFPRGRRQRPPIHTGRPTRDASHPCRESLVGPFCLQSS